MNKKFLKTKIREFIENKRSQFEAEDLKYFENEYFLEFLEKRSPELFVQKLIGYFQYRNFYNMINELCKLVIDSGHEKDLMGSSYYYWAIYYAKIGDLDKSEKMLKAASRRGYSGKYGLEKEDLDDESLSILGKETVYSILELE